MPPSQSFGDTYIAPQYGLSASYESPPLHHTTEKQFGEEITVVIIDGKKFLIGVEVAAMIHRETYNVYRSLKMKRVKLRRALQEQIEVLTDDRVIAVGTHSVTFIPYAEGLEFIFHSKQKINKRPRLSSGGRRNAKSSSARVRASMLGQRTDGEPNFDMQHLRHSISSSSASSSNISTRPLHSVETSILPFSSSAPRSSSSPVLSSPSDSVFSPSDFEQSSTTSHSIAEDSLISWRPSTSSVSALACVALDEVPTLSSCFRNSSHSMKLSSPGSSFSCSEPNRRTTPQYPTAAGVSPQRTSFKSSPVSSTASLRSRDSLCRAIQAQEVAAIAQDTSSTLSSPSKSYQW